MSNVSVILVAYTALQGLRQNDRLGSRPVSARFLKLKNACPKADVFYLGDSDHSRRKPVDQRSRLKPCS